MSMAGPPAAVDNVVSTEGTVVEVAVDSGVDTDIAVADSDTATDAAGASPQPAWVTANNIIAETTPANSTIRPCKARRPAPGACDILDTKTTLTPREAAV